MTISLNRIEGRKGSACKNDSFSVVYTPADGRTPLVLDFIPAAQIKTEEDYSRVKTAYEDALVESASQLAKRKLALG